MKEHKSEPQTASFLPSIILIGVGLLMIFLCNTLMKNWIIIGFGVRAFKLVQGVTIGVFVVGTLIAVIQTFFFVKMKSAQKRKQEEKLARERRQSQVMTEYAEDSANPELTRKMLEQLCHDNPEFTDLVERCVDQMMRMDRLQAKQEILIKTNSALYLKDTVNVFNNVERRICRNFQNIINMCIAADGPEYLDEDKVNANFEDNNQKLSDAKKLLDVSVTWINEYNQNNDNSDRSEVENWIEVIRESLKEG